MWIQAIRSGFQKGMRTTWELMRIIVPVYVFVAFIVQTPFMDWIATGIAPAMNVFGLSPEAAIPLTLGIITGLYAAIGAMASLQLTAAEMFIIAVMLGFAHNVFVESAVTRRLGISFRFVVSLRIGLAVVGGLLTRLII